MVGEEVTVLQDEVDMVLQGVVMGRVQTRGEATDQEGCILRVQCEEVALLLLRRAIQGTQPMVHTTAVRLRHHPMQAAAMGRFDQHLRGQDPRRIAIMGRSDQRRQAQRHHIEAPDH
jgi:hypothetical protein